MKTMTVEMNSDSIEFISSVELEEELPASLTPLLVEPPNGISFYARMRRVVLKDGNVKLFSSLTAKVKKEGNNNPRSIHNLALLVEMIHKRAINARMQICVMFETMNKFIYHEEDESSQAEQSQSHGSCAD